MEYFWAVFLSIILLLIIWGIVSAKIRERRMRKGTAKMLPTLEQHFEAGRQYNVFLSHGHLLQQVRFVGISQSYRHKRPGLPFPLCQSVVLEREDGKHLYIKPETIRYYEDAVPPNA
jgi:hypothetical protein